MAKHITGYNSFENYYERLEDFRNLNVTPSVGPDKS
jgi:hypothetical protein